MASGERITVTYARTAGRTPLQLDVYAFAPAVDPGDPSPTFASHQRLPFILFLHGGHFLTGSRRDVPPWLASLARSMGTPLLCADYRLAPHAGPSHAWADVAQLWRFLAEELNWIIAASGNGADVESGSEPLDRGFAELQRRGGIDVSKGIVVGVGSGGYLGAMGGALLSPPPLAVILGYPLLELGDKAGTYDPPGNLPTRLANLLYCGDVGKAHLAQSDVPDMPMLLQRAPYATEVRARSGMDMREPWRGKEESTRRSGVTGLLLESGRFDALMTHASPGLVTPAEVVLADDADPILNTSGANMQRHRNRPYPPTLIFHGMQDTRTKPDGALQFLDAIRRSEPAAALLDSFAQDAVGELEEQERKLSRREMTSRRRTKADDAALTTSPLHCIPAEPNHMSRYLFMGVEGHGSGHGFDALLPRTLSTVAPSMGVPSHRGPTVLSDRYRASMMPVERFMRHWMNEGSATLAAAQNRRLQLQRRQEAAGVERDSSQTTGDGPSSSLPAAGGARIRIPARGPRL